MKVSDRIALVTLAAILTTAAAPVPTRRRSARCCWNEPELFDYRQMKVVDPRYPLRPEIIESAFYLYRYTKDPRYLEMGRVLFEGIRKQCRTEAGETVLKSVVTGEKEDLMPSYFLA